MGEFSERDFLDTPKSPHVLPTQTAFVALSWFDLCSPAIASSKSMGQESK